VLLSGNFIQLTGYVYQIRYWPRKTPEELAAMKIQMDAEYEARQLADPDIKRRRRKPPQRADMFLASLKTKGPMKNKWSEWWKFFCYGHTARTCYQIAKEGDRITIQGIPTIRTHPAFLNGVGRNPQVWASRIFPEYTGLNASLMQKLHLDGSCTIDMVTDEEAEMGL
jgi:hypothetical protein